MTREDRLFTRAVAIMQRRANGHYLPILDHLARRGYAPAMSRFNIGDLQGYRLWLRRTKMLGDDDAGHELGHFETRLPHGAAHAIRRGRPWRRSER